MLNKVGPIITYECSRATKTGKNCLLKNLVTTLASLVLVQWPPPIWKHSQQQQEDTCFQIRKEKDPENQYPKHQKSKPQQWDALAWH